MRQRSRTPSPKRDLQPPGGSRADEQHGAVLNLFDLQTKQTNKTKRKHLHLDEDDTVVEQHVEQVDEVDVAPDHEDPLDHNHLETIHVEDEITC